jgi:hypothetical protein
MVCEQQTWRIMNEPRVIKTFRFIIIHDGDDQNGTILYEEGSCKDIDFEQFRYVDLYELITLALFGIIL